MVLGAGCQALCDGAGMMLKSSRPLGAFSEDPFSVHRAERLENVVLRDECLEIIWETNSYKQKREPSSAFALNTQTELCKNELDLLCVKAQDALGAWCCVFPLHSRVVAHVDLLEHHFGAWKPSKQGCCLHSVPTAVVCYEHKLLGLGSCGHCHAGIRLAVLAVLSNSGWRWYFTAICWDSPCWDLEQLLVLNGLGDIIEKHAQFLYCS